MNLKKAKENRKKFLKPYRKKFKTAEKELENLKADAADIELYKLKIGRVETEKQRPEINKQMSAIKRKEKALKQKRVKIISQLIELEPSHISEPWIIKEVIYLLRDRNSFDIIEEIFIKAPKRGTRTKNKKLNEARDFYVVNDIDKIIAEKNVSVREACSVLALQEYEKKERYYLLWDTNDEGHDLEKAIRQVYNKAKNPSTRCLPWPYYGRDVEVDENGNITIFAGR